jgi:transposase InsO family protein
MSRRGNCWDNAVTESFFHTLKGHVVLGSVFATRKEANTVLFDYIEIYYNRVRRHSANGWLSPEAFEQKYFKNLEVVFKKLCHFLKLLKTGMMHYGNYI